MITTFAASPAVRAYLIKRRSYDIPNHRSSHTQPVPRGGGLALFAGMAAGLAATGRESGVSRKTVLAVSGLGLVGLIDDRTGHVPPQVRLAAQCMSGALLNTGRPALSPVAAVGTAGVVNVVNFMDGINGISGSTAAVWGLSALLSGREVRNHSLQTVGALTAGAGLGFLPWNVPNAKLFLGDVGSYLLGGAMAAGLAQARSDWQLAWRLAAPLLPYGLDASQALVRRAIRGESLTEAHREHVYQRLVDRHGWSHAQVSALHASVAVAVGLLARQRSLVGSCAASTAVALAYIAVPDLLELSGEAS